MKKDIKESSSWATVKITAVEYSEVATTHGIYYVFEHKFGSLSRILWALICTALLCVGIILILNAYNTWQDNPVITSVKTTGLPIRKLEFPAVTFCGLGMIESALQESIYRQMLDYTFQNKKKQTNYSDFVESSLSDILNKQNLSIDDFVNSYYPGLDPEAELSEIFPILASPNPDAYIFSKIAIDGGATVSECYNSTSADNTVPDSACGYGFDHDDEWRQCYIVREQGNNDDALENICSAENGEQLLQFYGSSQITNLKSFIATQTGKYKSV